MRCICYWYCWWAFSTRRRTRCIILVQVALPAARLPYFQSSRLINDKCHSADSCGWADRKVAGVHPRCYYSFAGDSQLHISFEPSHVSFQDSFYKHHSPEELELAHANKLDFDHPDAIDMPMFAAVSWIPWLEKPRSTLSLSQCLADLKACKQSNIPVYSFAQHQRLAETKYLYGASIIIGSSLNLMPSEAHGP